MTEQRLAYAKSVLEQKNKIKEDLDWVEYLPEKKKLTQHDIDKLKTIAFSALESLLSRIETEFKSL